MHLPSPRVVRWSRPKGSIVNQLFGRIASGSIAKLSLVLDLVVLMLALVAASVLSGHPLTLMMPFGTAGCVLALGTWLVTAMALRHYDPWASDRPLPDDLALTSILVMAVVTMLACAQFALGDGPLPHVELFLVIFWPAALLMRVSLFRAFSERGAPVDEVLVVGAGAMGHATADDIARRRHYHVLGHLRFSDEAVAGPMKGKVLGLTSELDSVLRSMPVAEVYLATTSTAHAAQTQTAIRTCERFGVPFALPAYMFRLVRARPLDSHAVGDGYVHYQSVECKPTQMALKRLFDLVTSAVALWVLMPLLALAALAIKLTSKGPLLFRQTRVGLHGRPFRMLKFRTMNVNAEAQKASLAALNEVDGPVFKITNDPRVTKVGRFLRKFSIDELPQLVNVVRGDMSIVGPRPPLPNEVAKYEGWQRRRLSVRPGLTCIWQVSGRNTLSFQQWMYLDMQYIDTWTFTKDLQLILRTVPVVLTGRGAS